MTRLLLIVGLLFVSVPAFAQTVERTIDLPSIGWGSIAVHDVDTDRDPSTTEYAVEGTDYFNGNMGLWRIVAIRTEGICVGEWFDPRPAGAMVSSVILTGSKLVVKAWVGFPPIGQQLTIVRLDTPTCQ